jgi:hypothetical protein
MQSACCFVHNSFSKNQIAEAGVSGFDYGAIKRHTDVFATLRTKPVAPVIEKPSLVNAMRWKNETLLLRLLVCLLAEVCRRSR